MGGRGKPSAMSSEVVGSTSGVSLASVVGSGGSGGAGASAKPAAVPGGSSNDQAESPTNRRERQRERESLESLVVPDQELDSYGSVYTDKPEYLAFRKWADDRFSTEITDSERGALTYYKGNGYRSMNAELRGFQTPTAMNKGYTERLDSAMKGKSLGRDLIVYRGLHANFEHEVGMIYQDKGFMSTSLNPNAAFGGKTFLRIHASSKTQGMFIENMRMYSKNAPKAKLHGLKEHEVLFARGSHYMVMGKSKVKTMYGEREALDVVLLERGD